MLSFRLLLLLLILISGTLSSDLPSGWEVCKKNRPDRNECLKKAIKYAIDTLINGNKKLGMLPLDPLRFDEVHTMGNSNGPVALDVLFKDVYLYNLRNHEIYDVKLEGRVLTLKAKVPGKLVIKSSYSVKGKMLAVPLVGKGMSNFSYHEGNFTHVMKFKEKPELRNKKQYLLLEKFVMRSYPQKLDIHLDNLFNGNKVLGEAMNRVLNEHWDVVWTELKPLVEDAVSEALLQIANKVFSKIPMNEIGLF